MDLDGMRGLFPVTRRYAYLAHAAVSPISTTVRGAIQRLARRLSERGMAGRLPLFEVASALKDRLAGMLDVPTESLALTRNTTEGVLIAANGLPLRRGDNVVIAAGEFPANVHPWRALKKKGVEMRTAPEAGGRIPIEGLAHLVDDRTAAVSVSFVEFATGYRNDLASIGRLARDADALFVVDGIQGLGALRLHPAKAGVDVLASGAHKWMLACPGIGFAYFSQRAMDRLSVASMGWLGVEDPEDFSRYDQPLAEGARRFETGSIDILGAAALTAAIDMLEDVGLDVVEARVLELAEYVEGRAREAGIPVLSPREAPEERSGIVVLGTPGKDPEAVTRRAARAGVIVTSRGGGIRVAAHAYNTEEELDRLVELLLSDDDRV